MAKKLDKYFSCCLYFTANALAKEITNMAEEEFAKLGLSSSQAFLLMLAVEQPGISQKEQAKYLNLAPSTASRFTDKMISRGLLQKEVNGRNICVYPTDTGNKLCLEIETAWQQLHKRYSDLLGENGGKLITEKTYQAFLKLKNR